MIECEFSFYFSTFRLIFLSHVTGYYKTGKACPAGFSVKKLTNNSKIIVEVCNTHVGHECSLDRVSLRRGSQKTGEGSRVG